MDSRRGAMSSPAMVTGGTAALASQGGRLSAGLGDSVVTAAKRGLL